MVGLLNSRPSYLITTVCLYFDLGNVKILAFENKKASKNWAEKIRDLKVHKFWENHKHLTKSANWFEFCSVIDKSTWTFRHIFLAFSEYMNFAWNYKWECSLWNVKSHYAILHGIFCSLLSFISIGGHRFLFWL